MNIIQKYKLYKSIKCAPVKTEYDKCNEVFVTRVGKYDITASLILPDYDGEHNGRHSLIVDIPNKREVFNGLFARVMFNKMRTKAATIREHTK